MTRFVTEDYKPDNPPTVIRLRQEGDCVWIMAGTGEAKQDIGWLGTDGALHLVWMDDYHTERLGIALSGDSTIKVCR